MLVACRPHAITRRDLLGDFYGDAFCPGNSTARDRVDGCVPTIGGSVRELLTGLRSDVQVNVEPGVPVLPDAQHPQCNDTVYRAAFAAAVVRPPRIPPSVHPFHTRRDRVATMELRMVATTDVTDHMTEWQP